MFFNVYLDFVDQKRKNQVVGTCIGCSMVKSDPAEPESVLLFHIVVVKDLDFFGKERDIRTLTVHCQSVYLDILF